MSHPWDPSHRASNRCVANTSLQGVSEAWTQSPYRILEHFWPGLQISSLVRSVPYFTAIFHTLFVPKLSKVQITYLSLFRLMHAFHRQINHYVVSLQNECQVVYHNCYRHIVEHLQYIQSIFPNTGNAVLYMPRTNRGRVHRIFRGLFYSLALLNPNYVSWIGEI